MTRTEVRAVQGPQILNRLSACFVKVVVGAPLLHLSLISQTGLISRVGHYRGIVTRYFFSTVIGTVDAF